MPGTESNTEEQDAARIRRSIFLPLALFVFFAACYGLYQVSYSVWDYFADEAQNQPEEAELRFWALVAAVVVGASAGALLALANSGRVVPQDGRTWSGALLFAITLVLCQTLGSYNAMPTFSTLDWFHLYQPVYEAHDPDGNLYNSRRNPIAHRKLHDETIQFLREERCWSPQLLLVPIVLAAGFAVASGRNPREVHG